MYGVGEREGGGWEEEEERTKNGKDEGHTPRALGEGIRKEDLERLIDK